MQEKETNLRKCKRKHKRFCPGSVLLTYIQFPSNPLEIFLILDFVYPKSTSVHHLTNHPLPNAYNSSYTKKTTTPCTTSLQPEDALVQSFSLSNYNQSYKPWICMWSWTRTLISGLLVIFTKGLEFEWRIESRNSFLKNRILNRVFGQKTIDMNWYF